MKYSNEKFNKYIPDKVREKVLYSLKGLIIKSVGFKISSLSFKCPMIP